MRASDVATAVQETELRELRKKAADQKQLLRQQEEFARRGDDVRQLVVARNLHIIDVHDRDGNGQSQRAFGRIFYTEGKSLIFYAYDLADPRKVDAKVSFYVWGGRLSADKPVRNLGIFNSRMRFSNSVGIVDRTCMTIPDAQFALSRLRAIAGTILSQWDLCESCPELQRFKMTPIFWRRFHAPYVARFSQSQT